MNVDFLLRGGVDVGEEVGEVLRGLEVDFPVVGVHCLLWASGAVGAYFLPAGKPVQGGGCITC